MGDVHVIDRGRKDPRHLPVAVGQRAVAVDDSVTAVAAAAA